ncbi:MAG TPA: hypothetical protein VEH30_17075 [Terriglobales bacterium]|nr:hypothetical protein [Terriglobales bacterium]
MNGILKSFVVVCTLAMAAVWTAPAHAQMSDVKEKSRMYSYVGFWNIPRSQWGEMEKSDAADLKTLEKALANGTIVGYGTDLNLLHEADGATHDQWWSAMSLAGLLNVLDQFYKSGSATSPVLGTATKHWDSIYVSRYYNWHPGSWKDVYTSGSCFKLKADAPSDALDVLSKNLLVPLLEKMMAEGAVHEYEIDTEAYHRQPVSNFCIFEIVANAEALDKVGAAVRESFKSNPTYGPTFDSMVDWTGHRDELTRTNATYK